MIYTVTFNPCLDYIVTVENFRTGRVNRTGSEFVYPGGKGVNVSLVLKNLGIDNTALGFVAGFTGAEIERALKGWGCITDFIPVKEGMSRINMKIRSYESCFKEEIRQGKKAVRKAALEETEINGQGPVISQKELTLFYKKLEKLEEGDILVLAGSIPGSMPASAYEDIMERLKEKKIEIVVDATGELLVKVLKYHPFLIKPNQYELEEIFQVTIKGKEEIISYGKRLQEMGARNVLISMAGDGAILLAENGRVYESPAPKGNVVNSVGAGDSMVAGFITGYLKERDYNQGFLMGIAAGSASAFSEGLATREEVEAILAKLIK